MITERQFAAAYASFWHQLLPGAERFVRRINLSASRFAPRIRTTGPNRNRGLVNETAFRLYCMNPRCTDFRALDINAAMEAARAYISRFREFSATSDLPDLTRDQLAEAILLASRLRGVIEKSFPKSHVKPRPEFEGCGLVSRCEGDLLVDVTLLEVKAGERPFRSSDFRQVLVYLTLNHVVRANDIDEVCFINPRLGMTFRALTEDMCFDVSGQSAVEIYEEIADFLCEEGMLRGSS